MHGIILPDSRDFSPVLLDKFRISIPDYNLHPTRLGYLQLLSLKTIPSDNCFLLPFKRNNSGSLITSKTNSITVLGTWFINKQIDFIYPYLLHLIFENIKKNYSDCAIKYLPHNMSSERLPSKLIETYDVQITSSMLLSSKRIFSFFSTLSIEMFESYSIPSTFITLDFESYSYIKSICSELPGFDVFNIETKQIKI